MKEEINQKACWQRHIDWNTSRAILFEDIHLPTEKIEQIKKGQKVRSGSWVFSPIIYD